MDKYKLATILTELEANQIEIVEAERKIKRLFMKKNQRLKIAAMAMNGLISNGYEADCKEALSIADALIKQEVQS